MIATGNPAEPSSSGRQELLGQILKRMELVTEENIQQALEIQREKGGVIGGILVGLGFASPEEVKLALSVQMGAVIVSLQEMNPIPIQGLIDVIRHQEKLRDEVRFEKLEGKEGKGLPIDDLANSTPVMKLVNLILLTATNAGATEVRFEAEGEKFSVRYRVEGILYEMESPPFHLHSPVIGRLMWETGMDVSQRTRAQEGRVMLCCAERKYLTEASYKPSRQGESIGLRLSQGPRDQG